MTKIFNFALKIKGGGREGGTCEVLRLCHPPKKNLKRAPSSLRVNRPYRFRQLSEMMI